MNYIVLSARWLLTIALLVVVWVHAHWSVALSITLLSINAEAASIKRSGWR